MTDFLRDPVWDFWAVVLAVIFGLAGVVSLFLQWRQHRRKELFYEITTNVPLLTFRDEVYGRLQILFDGQPIRNAHMILLTVGNSGNEPILPVDFISPLALSFGEESQILSAEITTMNPDDLGASIAVDDRRIILSPVLMNRGDFLSLRLFLTQPPEGINVDARIVGVERIREVSSAEGSRSGAVMKKLRKEFRLFSFVSFLALFIFAVVLTTVIIVEKGQWDAVVMPITVIVVYLAFLLSR